MPSRRAHAASRAGGDGSARGAGRAGGGSTPSRGATAWPPPAITGTGSPVGTGRACSPGRSTDRGGAAGVAGGRGDGGGHAEQLRQRHEPEAAGPVAGDDRRQRPRRHGRSRVEQDDRAGASGGGAPDHAANRRAAPRCPRPSCPTGPRTGSRRRPPADPSSRSCRRMGAEIREHRLPGRLLHDLAGQGQVLRHHVRCQVPGVAVEVGVVGQREAGGRDPAPERRRSLDVDAGHEERCRDVLADEDPVDLPQGGGAPAVVERQGHDAVRARTVPDEHRRLVDRGRVGGPCGRRPARGPPERRRRGHDRRRQDGRQDHAGDRPEANEGEGRETGGQKAAVAAASSVLDQPAPDPSPRLPEGAGPLEVRDDERRRKLRRGGRVAGGSGEHAARIRPHPEPGAEAVDRPARRHLTARRSACAGRLDRAGPPSRETSRMREGAPAPGPPRVTGAW